MRKKIIAGNWKMNTTLDDAITLFNEIETLLHTTAQPQNTTTIIAPPFVFLQNLVQLAKLKGNISIAAQNCSSEPAGAFTGEVSAKMLQSIGVEYVIIGHSERRIYYAETNAMLTKKVNEALKENLNPIFCVGELLQERESSTHFSIIKQQLSESLFHLTANDFKKITIAYEPVWAIGTGLTASTPQAQEMHHYIRSLIAEQYNSQIAQATSILYGGSCNANNAKDLFNCPDVDGGLIGGASLKAQDFNAIINSF